MLPSPSRLARRGAVSLVVVAALLVPRACIEIDQTMTFHPDRSGSMEFALRVDEEQVQEFTGDTAAMTPDQAEEEFFGDLRAAVDTVQEVHFDTAWAQRDGRFVQGSALLRLDGPEVVNAVGESGGDSPVTTNIRAEDGSIRVVHRGQPVVKKGGETNPQTKQMTDAIVEGLMRHRYRYVFPAGTEVKASEPPASRTDTSVVWEVSAESLVGTSAADSAYLEVELP